MVPELSLNMPAGTTLPGASSGETKSIESQLESMASTSKAPSMTSSFLSLEQALTDMGVLNRQDHSRLDIANNDVRIRNALEALREAATGCKLGIESSTGGELKYQPPEHPEKTARKNLTDAVSLMTMLGAQDIKVDVVLAERHLREMAKAMNQVKTTFVESFQDKQLTDEWEPYFRALEMTIIEMHARLRSRLVLSSEKALV
jgi:hypothetical protein